MALNPFFLQGSQGEQRLVQELINEQLKIYGVEVTYIPRKFVRRQTVIEEVQSSKFDDNFLLEAYINTYDGYSGAGDILTKFGMSIRDELSLTISKERFEDFISPFLDAGSDTEYELSTRPREGDLIYFPLGQRLFEVKFVEHENPFYQLGKNYVYELKCELFEYEDETLDTTIEEIDTVLEDTGYIVDLNLLSSGTDATAITTKVIGGVERIYLNNDGYSYTSTPTVSISAAPVGGVTAEAVAITTFKGGVNSVKEILLINPGLGYTTNPTVTISGGGGFGAIATCGITTSGIGSITMSEVGQGYTSPPIVTISSPVGGGTTATAKSVINSSGQVTGIRIINSGVGYTSAPTITIGVAATTGIGTYQFNETVTGSISSTSARVKNWDTDTNILRVGILTGTFYPGEMIVGAASSASYVLNVSTANTTTDKYKQNETIETEADLILDFTESNPFGTY
jgi:hypothetical protein